MDNSAQATRELLFETLLDTMSARRVSNENNVCTFGKRVLRREFLRKPYPLVCSACHFILTE